LVDIFRRAAWSGKGVSWEGLVRRVARRLKELECQRTPVPAAGGDEGAVLIG
jgi:hypothetical protein